jgi:hypothetical protein
MTERDGNRVPVELDAAHAARLHRLAYRNGLSVETMARALLGRQLDQADPGAAVTALLDAIPGADERARQGLQESQAGQVVALEDL